MPNVFSNSLDQLGQWLSSPDGQRAFTVQPNTPLATSPDLVRPPAAQNPQGRTLFGMVARPIQYQPISSQGMPYTPGGQSGMAVSPSSVWSPNPPSPQPPATRVGASGDWDYTDDQQPTGVPTMVPTGDVGGRTNLPTHVIAPYRPTMTPTGQVTGAPSGTPQQPWGRPMGGPAPYVSPTNQAAQAAQSRGAGQPSTSPTPYTSPTNQAALDAANKITHKIEGPRGSTTITHQAKTPGQGTGQGGGPSSQGGVLGPDVGTGQTGYIYPNQAAATAGGTTGQGAIGMGPAGAGGQGATSVGATGQNVNLQVPAHPGLLQRIAQTIGHFFSGTLGQYQQPPGQYAGAPVQNQTGGSALSGISRALATGRQHVATHGRSSPASAPTPTFTPTGYVSGIGTTAGGPTGNTGAFTGQPSAAYTATGEPQPLGDTNIVTLADGRKVRMDVTNPGYRTNL